MSARPSSRQAVLGNYMNNTRSSYCTLPFGRSRSSLNRTRSSSRASFTPSQVHESQRPLINRLSVPLTRGRSTPPALLHTTNPVGAIDVVKGDTAFKGNDFWLSVKHYSDAIGLEPQNERLYARRAASWMNLGEVAAASRDTDAVVQINPASLKGKLRKKVVDDYKRKYEQGEPGWETAHKTALKFMTVNQRF